MCRSTGLQISPLWLSAKQVPRAGRDSSVSSPQSYHHHHHHHPFPRHHHHSLLHRHPHSSSSIIIVIIVILLIILHHPSPSSSSSSSFIILFLILILLLLSRRCKLPCFEYAVDKQLPQQAKRLFEKLNPYPSIVVNFEIRRPDGQKDRQDIIIYLGWQILDNPVQNTWSVVVEGTSNPCLFPARHAHIQIHAINKNTRKVRMS